MNKQDKKTPEEASNIFHNIMKASVTPKKDNEFIVNAQIIVDDKQHDLTSIKIVTTESSPKSYYNKIKSDLTDAYKTRYPNSSIAIVILP